MKKKGERKSGGRERERGGGGGRGQSRRQVGLGA